MNMQRSEFELNVAANSTSSRFGVLARIDVSQFTLFIELLVIFGLFAALTHGVFLESRNLSNLLMQSVTFALIVIPMVFVMVEGHIDLSVGSVVGFLGTVAATMQVNLGMSTLVTIAATIAIGVLVGLWHGYWVAYRQLPSFIVTLTGLLIFKGLNLLIGNGAAIGPVSDSFAVLGSGYLPSIVFENDTTLYLAALAALAVVAFSLRTRRSKMAHGLRVAPLRTDIVFMLAWIVTIAIIGGVLFSYRGISYAGLLLVVLAAAFSFAADNTRLGRYVYAIGGNKDAARLSGVNTRRTTMIVFLIMGFMTSVASIVFLGRVAQATALAGVNFEFTVITGAIVGGVSTLGGQGRIVGAIIGTILIASLDNGMSLLNLGTTYQYLAKGLVLLLAVAIDVGSRNKSPA